MDTLLNKAVADRLGLSESGVSRLRSGARRPSLSVMQQIENVYGWTVQEQSNSIKASQWPQGFALTLGMDSRQHQDTTAE